MGDVEAQPVAVQQVQPQVRPMIGPGGVGLDIAPEPQTMVQNATGAVQVGGNRNGMGMAFDLPGQAPVVQKGLESRTIAVEGRYGCCFRMQFRPLYEDGKLSLSPAEFHDSVQEINDAAAPCFTFICCCCYCNKCKFDSKCQEMNRKYADKRLEFHMHTRYQMTVGVGRQGVRAGRRGKLSLVITQH